MKTIFVALTSYQLYISSIYACYIKEHGLSDDVRIISVGISNLFLPDDTGIDFFEIEDLNKSYLKRVWQRLYWAGRLFCFCPLKKYIKGSKIALYIFNDNEPITSNLIREVKKTNAIVSIIEEGIGIYAVTKDEIKGSAVRRFITCLLGSPMQYKAIADNKNIDNVICSNISLYKSLEKSRGKNLFLQDKNGLFSYAEGHIRGINNGDIRKDADVMILGQPFSTFGTLIDEEESFYTKILELVPAKYSIIIKPHPRDAIDKYDCFQSHRCHIINNIEAQYPVESLISLYHVRFVVSFNSSAGINIANSYPQIKSCFLFQSNFGLELFNRWSNTYSDYDLSIFTSKYNNIYLVRNQDELLKVFSLDDSCKTGIEQNNKNESIILEEINESLAVISKDLTR